MIHLVSNCLYIILTELLLSGWWAQGAFLHVWKYGFYSWHWKNLKINTNKESEGLEILLSDKAHTLHTGYLGLIPGTNKPKTWSAVGLWLHWVILSYGIWIMDHQVLTWLVLLRQVLACLQLEWNDLSPVFSPFKGEGLVTQESLVTASRSHS